MAKAEKVDPYEDLSRMLRAYEVSASTIAKDLDISYPSALRRFKTPQILRVEELLTIVRKRNIPIGVVRETLKI